MAGLATPNYQAMAAGFAKQAGIDPGLFTNQIRQESGFQTGLTSSAGAKGIAQIMPQYHPGVNPDDPVASLKWAAGYMAGLVHKYGSYEKALSVYNSGKPDAYLDPHFANGQTYNYVRSIMGGRAGGIDTSLGAGAAPVGAGSEGRNPAPSARPAASDLFGSFLAQGNQMLGLPAPPPGLFESGAAPAARASTVAPSSAPARTMAASTAPASGTTIPFIEQFARPYGLTVTSTTGGKHAEGSYHYHARAVDFGGPSARMAQLAYAAIEHPQDFREMFYSGPGHPPYFIKNGELIPLKQLDPGLYKEHLNHVHLAA